MNNMVHTSHAGVADAELLCEVVVDPAAAKLGVGYALQNDAA